MQGWLDRSDRICRHALEGRGGLVLRILVFLLGSALCGWISVRLGAFDTWDLRNYQYYLPWAFLENRLAFDAGVAQIQTFLNPLPFLPFYWSASSLPPMGAGFVVGAVHGLAVGFVFLISLLLLGDLAPTARLVSALACTALGAWGPTFVPMLGGSGSDHVVAVVVLAGMWMLLRGLRGTGPPSRLWVSGGAVLIGAGAGLKLTALVFLIGMVAAAGVVSPRRPRGVLVIGLAGLCGVLLSRGHWMWFLYEQYGSPLFPFFNQWFRSPWFHTSNFADVRFLPGSIGEGLVYPFLFLGSNDFTTLSHGFRDGRYAAIYVLVLALIGLAVFRRLKSGHWSGAVTMEQSQLAFVVFAVVAYVVWQAKFAIMRYILPLELTAPALIIVLVRHLLPGRLAPMVVSVGLLAVVALSVQLRTVPRRDWGPAYLQVSAPRFENPESVLIVIANDRPWSYLVPFFQPEVRFLGVWNRFSRDENQQRHRAAQDMDAVMAAHEGEIYVLTSGTHREAALSHLRAYNPVRGVQSRPSVESIHERESVYLWRLVPK